MSEHSVEVASGERFEFGANWQRFLKLVDDERIAAAESALRSMLAVSSLAGRTFLDIGSGSGLMSLAARRLGASVRSFDFDPQSVACTLELRRRYFPDDPQWTVTSGSVLDAAFLSSLGTFDVVYSWGVLHHTGAMWKAITNAAERVTPGGALFIAIYNDQGFPSRYWRVVKRLYNRSRVTRVAMIALHVPNVFLARLLARTVSGRSETGRGMSLWYDMLDWLGGYPFEVARPEEILDHVRPLGFELARMTTCRGRYGCNEFVFRKLVIPAS